MINEYRRSCTPEPRAARTLERASPAPAGGAAHAYALLARTLAATSAALRRDRAVRIVLSLATYARASRYC